jgi:hypothetical protein
MAEIKEFIINDRRKFTAEGDVRPDAPPSEPKPARPEASLPTEPESSAHLVEKPAPHLVTEAPAAQHTGEPDTDDFAEEQGPPAPSAEQLAQAKRAFDATVDRLDTAIRAQNPGMGPIPTMSFERVIQSIYMQALMQLGGAAAPGQQPQVDLLGARQTIDMLSIVADKSTGNLSPGEESLMQSALFELRMGFLEVTQALARQAAQQAAPGSGIPGAPGGGKGPSIVR